MQIKGDMARPYLFFNFLGKNWLKPYLFVHINGKMTHTKY